MIANSKENSSNIKINAILNVIRQVLKIIFPLITYPYALRILGVENLGKVDYISSIITYFTLIASLGVSNYAIREGATKRNNKDEFSKFVSEVFSINLFSTAISFILLMSLTVFVDKLKPYITLIFIQSLSIIFLTFGTDWINVVFEDYFYITVRTIIIYIFTLFSLFIFVKEKNDYYIYSIITVVSNALICIINYFYCRKYVKIKFVFNKKILKHLKPILILFANHVAIQIYISADVTMLGWMDSNASVGLYSASVKIYNIIKNIMVAIYVVTVPKLVNLASKNDFDGYKKINTDLWGTMSLLLLPMAMGLFMLSKEILFILGGSELVAADVSLKILSVALILAIFGGLVTAVMNITLKRDKITLKATCLSALLNVILNIFLIPKYSINGTAFTTAIAEGFVFVFCFFSFKNINKYLDLRVVFKNLCHSIMGGIIIIVSYVCISNILTNTILIVFLVFVSSCIGYAFCLLILKNELFIDTLKSIIKKIKIKREKIEKSNN